MRTNTLFLLGLFLVTQQQSLAQSLLLILRGQPLRLSDALEEHIVLQEKTLK